MWGSSPELEKMLWKESKSVLHVTFRSKVKICITFILEIPFNVLTILEI